MTDYKVELLDSRLQLILQKRKVSLKALLLRKAQSAQTAIIGAQLDTRQATVHSGQLVLSECLNCGDRRWSHLSRASIHHGGTVKLTQSSLPSPAPPRRARGRKLRGLRGGARSEQSQTIQQRLRQHLQGMNVCHHHGKRAQGKARGQAQQDTTQGKALEPKWLRIDY